MQQIVDRSGKAIQSVEISKAQRFLYRTFFGRIILRILVTRMISRIGGLFLNSRLSRGMIKKFIIKNNIEVSRYEEKKYKSYNDFFCRKLKEENVCFSSEASIFCSPCDCKLSVYRINEQSVYKIKDAYYKISDLLKNEELAKKYIDGFCLICRLTVDDYHRYHYIDNGTKNKNTFIKGTLHTVNPIALEKYNFYKTNCREYTTLSTDNFGDVTQVEVGALMVGKIINNDNEATIYKGKEKGRFIFGGSTIVLLVEKNKIEVDPQLLANTDNGNETKIRCGEAIAKKATEEI